MLQQKILSIALIGSTGRFGKQILQQASIDKTLQIPLRIHTANFHDLDLISTCNVVLDASSPLILKQVLTSCLRHKLPLVIGSTGHNPEDVNLIKKSSHMIPILVSPNFSLGALILKTLCQKLASFQEFSKVRIEETHHIHKKDAPSGTALWLRQDLINARINSHRHHETPGIHEVIFEIEDEVLSLRHTANSRRPFAIGALQAAKWIVKQEPGYYTGLDFANSLLN